MLKNRAIGRILSIIFAVALCLFIITFSISLPIYFRPFYYMHIDALSLTDSGFTAEEIKTAYNEVLDFLTLPSREFSCGILGYTESGAAHFADCKVLFNLNAAVLVLSGIVLIALAILRKKNRTLPYRLLNRSAAFYSGIFALFIPTIIGCVAAIDFDLAFTIFHLVFFPGKTNWEFYPSKDEIINVLPEKFFMNCAILIGISIFTLSLICIIKGFKRNQNEIENY